MSEPADSKFCIDPYLDWAAGEGVPIVEDFAVDLHKVDTKPWARFGTDGAIIHTHGRGDFVTLFVIDLPPGGASEPMSHVFDEVYFVLSGSGSATVETADGGQHTFEWVKRPVCLALRKEMAWRTLSARRLQKKRVFPNVERRARARRLWSRWAQGMSMRPGNFWRCFHMILIPKTPLSMRLVSKTSRT